MMNGLLQRIKEHKALIRERIIGAVKTVIGSFYHIPAVPFLRFVFVANVLDAFLTLHWINIRAAEESNPLMAALIDIDPLLFLFVKVVGVTSACVFLYFLRSHLATKISAVLVALVYYVVLLYHFLGGIREGLIRLPTENELISNFYEAIEFVENWLETLLSSVGVV